ncbi:MAG: glutamate--tRNA ligase [Gammaproteobacteria bacterium]|nr:glutamate--tRNA ligase [Gammaproteobacteria bacterium]
MTVVTRFAPSPTGFLHIGGARTALFNWLYARHCGGKFVLRIEDTDRKRSTAEAIAAILDGLDWLGLDRDGEDVYQSGRAHRHAEMARALLDQGKAYHCYCTPDELRQMRETARAEGRTMLYDGRWRDRDPAEAPPDVPPVVRFKAPREGETIIEDAVQGTVRVANQQLDDMVLLRADGTPTYMLSVVIDDHDMEISHVIRGDDHLTNAFRQTQLFRSLGWAPPVYGHIPLIHGADGAKLSKRHGALGIDAYRDMGYLPEAVRNYLLRLGWSHGDDEIIGTEQAIEWFDLANIGRAPAQFDFDRLNSLNAHYLRAADDGRLLELIAPAIAEDPLCAFDDAARDRTKRGMRGLKKRAKTIEELAGNARLYSLKHPLQLNQKASRLLDAEACGRLRRLRDVFAGLMDWTDHGIETALREFADAEGVKLGQVAQPLRASLTATTVSPSIFEVAEILGKEESLARIGDVLKG